jgi:hypothetical protein
MSAAKKKEQPNIEALQNEFTSESAFFQPASTQVHKPTSGQTDKPVSPLVVKYTTHLLPSTIKAIKVFAAAHDLKDYEVVQVAVSEFLEKQKEK